jgi:hypothetical protein
MAVNQKHFTKEGRLFGSKQRIKLKKNGRLRLIPEGLWSPALFCLK